MTDKTPTDAQQYLNVASQCAATATSELAKNVLVDGGSGTLRELLNDAADAIRAGWGQPAQAQAGAVPLDEARRLFDAGWKAAAMLCDREDVVADGIIGFGACPQFEAAFSAAQPVAREPLTDAMVSRAGRALSDVYATECGVDKEDNWKIYGSDFIETARLVLGAAHDIKGGQHGTE